MKTCSLFILSILLLLPLNVAASPLEGLLPPDQYHSYIIGILDKDPQQGFEFEFFFDGDFSSGHGGLEKSFKYKNHEVVAIADAKWLGLAWRENGKKVGEAVNVQTQEPVSSRVLILVHPKNEDRVSITCDLETQ